MKKILFFIDKELHAKLVGEKEKTGAPMSEIIRRALRAYLKGGD